MKKALLFCFAVVVTAAGIQGGLHVADGQTNPQVIDIAWRRADGHAFVVTTGDAIFANPGNCGQWIYCGQLPPGETAVALLDGDVGGSLDIMCASGNAYNVQGTVPNISLVYCSSLYAGPTPTKGQTWGSLKSRYR